jgi:hypothetical protein
MRQPRDGKRSYGFDFRCELGTGTGANAFRRPSIVFDAR